MATKKATTAKAKADTGKTDYTKAKLATHSKIKKGATFTYTGRVKALDGKRVTVVDFESRGGVHVKAGEKAFTVSPFALLGNGVERPSAKKPKAKAPAKPSNGNGKANGHTK